MEQLKDDLLGFILLLFVIGWIDWAWIFGWNSRGRLGVDIRRVLRIDHRRQLHTFRLAIGWSDRVIDPGGNILNDSIFEISGVG